MKCHQGGLNLKFQPLIVFDFLKIFEIEPTEFLQFFSQKLKIFKLFLDLSLNILNAKKATVLIIKKFMRIGYNGVNVKNSVRMMKHIFSSLSVLNLLFDLMEVGEKLSNKIRGFILARFIYGGLH